MVPRQPWEIASDSFFRFSLFAFHLDAKLPWHVVKEIPGPAGPSPGFTFPSCHLSHEALNSNVTALILSIFEIPMIPLGASHLSSVVESIAGLKKYLIFWKSQMTSTAKPKAQGGWPGWLVSCGVSRRVTARTEIFPVCHLSSSSSSQWRPLKE